MSIFQTLFGNNTELNKYKAALAFSEQENKRLFASLNETKTKLRDACWQINRLESKLGEFDKWTKILENGEKEPIIEEAKK